MAKYKYISNNPGNFIKKLKTLGINLRTLSDAQFLLMKNGKKLNKMPNQYKCGYYNTWNNKQIYYRSSYELDYAKELDEKKINYEVESLRIVYWDSQKYKQRVAIPDFYLPETNTIVEIKGGYTYDEQNMKDKKNAYENHGYNFKLILEHKEMFI
jgi:hypothetical protein